MEKLWRAKHVSIWLKKNIFKASVVSVFLYGCETWIVSQIMADKINSFATSCYRIMLGIRRIDKVRNAYVLATMEERSLLETVYDRQLSWIGHALRRGETEAAYIFALYDPRHGKAPRGRPSTTYLQYIAELLNIPTGLATAQHIVDLARDRKLWKTTTARAIKNQGQRIADEGI